MLNQIVKFNVKPEFVERFNEALIADKKGADQEAGFHEMRIFADKKDPSIIFAYERLEDQAALDQHSAQDYTKTVMELAQTALVQPPEFFSLGETALVPDHSKQPNAEDDVCVIFFIFKFKEGYRDRLLAQFEDHIGHTRQEAGNIIFDLYTVDGADDTLVVYEHWRRESDVWDIHFKQPYAEVTGALLAEAVEGDLTQFMSFVSEID
jgi:quinol monooxygenase YgiN